ncbi:unnamed protein product [Rangifer tarandus platyrhynchus]|uniref:Uncharacterized protein n=1 Tax=Rangifer tarandus platyrhynchus TaxID=3082113 RepID=A0ABN8YL05_RANTA|nr:unnamed protein product [Rangifer tarandus platyrhynchus]
MEKFLLHFHIIKLINLKFHLDSELQKIFLITHGEEAYIHGLCSTCIVSAFTFKSLVCLFIPVYAVRCELTSFCQILSSCPALLKKKNLSVSTSGLSIVFYMFEYLFDSITGFIVCFNV